MDVNNFYSKYEFLIICIKSSIDLTLPGSVFNNAVYFLCANVNVITADEVLFIPLKSVWGEVFPGYN